jgi:hypothetical protein
VPNRKLAEREIEVNSARDRDTGEEHQAYELRKMDNPRARRWVCTDRKCEARMAVRACEPLNPDGNKPWKVAAYFKSDEDHSPDCQAWRVNRSPQGRPEPVSTMGNSVGYPNRVYLFSDPPQRRASVPLTSDAGAETAYDGSDRLHNSRSRGIGAACAFYAEDAANHLRSLWVQGCAGRTYAECFVLLGTGDEKIVGTRRIFYDQIHFRSRIDYDGEPLRITLLSTVRGVHRVVSIHTRTWSLDQRKDFKKQLRMHAGEGRRLHRPNEKVPRPWIFFVSTEEVFDQTEFDVYPHPGVHLRVCVLPRQQRRFRPSAFTRQPNQEKVSPYPPVGSIWPGVQPPEAEAMSAMRVQPPEADADVELTDIDTAEREIEAEPQLDEDEVAEPETIEAATPELSLAVLVQEALETEPVTDEAITAPIKSPDADRRARNDPPRVPTPAPPPTKRAPVRAWEALVAGLTKLATSIRG